MSEPIKMRKVAGYPTCREPGDFYFGSDGYGDRISFRTPSGAFCSIPVTDDGGEIGPWQWDGRSDTPTLTPSIWHDKGGADDWHGYITNGELVTA